jgi:excisionase family DNA binding protein
MRSTVADVITDRAPITASNDEKVQLGVVARLLTVDDDKAPSLVGSIGDPVALPTSLLRVLRRAVTALAHDDAVAVVTVQRLLTADAAADLLNVSRPYLLGLLDQGEIPSTGSGVDQRVALADLLAYKQRRDAQRREALRELTQMNQEFGLYEQH